ncbi:MAG: hypothetical protein ACLPVF_13815 [Acidimicrobiales bacterium]
MALDELRAQIDRGLRTRRYLGYYESRSWATEATPVIEAIRGALAASPSAELLGLIERAVGRVVKVILHADDSDGMIGDLARELLDLHTQACDAGVADPLKLARWMIRFCGRQRTRDHRSSGLHPGHEDPHTSQARSRPRWPHSLMATVGTSPV